MIILRALGLFFFTVPGYCITLDLTGYPNSVVVSGDTSNSALSDPTTLPTDTAVSLFLV